MSPPGLGSRLRNNVASAFRENLVPGLLLQGLALFVAWAFFYVPMARPAFDQLAQLKAESGLSFAIISTSLFGGLIPFSFLLLRGKVSGRLGAQALFFLGIWAFMGLLVDALYTQQAIWFGGDGSLETVAKKVAVDQLGFSAFFSCPFLALTYLWKERDFDWARTRASMNRDFFALQIPTTVITNWLVWTPAVCVIYALPSPLQVPLFNLVLCFFVLLLAVLDRD